MAFCPLWIALTKVVSVVVRTLISIVGLSLWEPVQDLRGSAAARVVLEPPAGALALHHLFARRGGGPFRDDASDGGEVLDERCELGVDERELLIGELQLPPRSSSPEKSTPTERFTGPVASASSTPAMAPLMSQVPSPCRRSPRRTSRCGGEL